MSMTIVKVQTPLFSNDQQMPALIYDERSTHLMQQPLDEQSRAQLRGDIKAFFNAEWDGQQWKLGKRVAYQDW